MSASNGLNPSSFDLWLGAQIAKATRDLAGADERLRSVSQQQQDAAGARAFASVILDGLLYCERLGVPVAAEDS